MRYEDWKLPIYVNSTVVGELNGVPMHLEDIGQAMVKVGLNALLRGEKSTSKTQFMRDYRNVYFGGEIKEEERKEKVNLLFEKKSFNRNKDINAIIEYDGKIIDAGGYGLYDTLENKVLISEEEIIKNNISCIKSLITDEFNLFGICYDFDNNKTLKELTGYSGHGDVVLDYKTNSRFVCQAQILPYGGFKGENGKHYDFSVLSCANNYLDLNGHKIEGSEVKERYYRLDICRLEVLEHFGKEVDIVYSGFNLNNIFQAKIDLEKKKVLEIKKLVKMLRLYVYALNIVRNPNLHKKLIKMGEKE